MIEGKNGVRSQIAALREYVAVQHTGWAGNSFGIIMRFPYKNHPRNSPYTLNSQE
jgi:hypothetical protein